MRSNPNAEEECFEMSVMVDEEEMTQTSGVRGGHARYHPDLSLKQGTGATLTLADTVVEAKVLRSWFRSGPFI